MEEMGSTTRKRRREEMVSALSVMVVASLVIGIPLLARIVVRHITIEMRQEITALEIEKNKLVSEMSELELQKAALSRPERIKEIAKKKLGMNEPSEGMIVIIPVLEGSDEK